MSYGHGCSSSNILTAAGGLVNAELGRLLGRQTGIAAKHGIRLMGQERIAWIKRQAEHGRQIGEDLKAARSVL